MSASTCVLVEMGEEDPIISVAQLVAGLIGDADGKVVKECESLLEAGKFTEVVSKIMAHGGKLCADAPEKDLEAAVLIIGGLAQRLSPADAAACRPGGHMGRASNAWVGGVRFERRTISTEERSRRKDRTGCNFEIRGGNDQLLIKLVEMYEL